MIIWGTTGRNSRVESGQFHCPRCGRDKPFDVVSVNRWFTIYFIPLIPMGEAGRFLECQNCSGTFDERVKHLDPEVEDAKFRASFEDAMMRSMLVMAQADGSVDEDELEVIADIMTQLSGVAHEADEVREVLRTCGHKTLNQVLEDVAASLNEDGRVMVLRGLFMVAMADGHLADDEAATLYEAGKQLGFRKKAIKQLLDSAEN